VAIPSLAGTTGRVDSAIVFSMRFVRASPTTVNHRAIHVMTAAILLSLLQKKKKNSSFAHSAHRLICLPSTRLQTSSYTTYRQIENKFTISTNYLINLNVEPIFASDLFIDLFIVLQWNDVLHCSTFD